ncbi:hypothetical protein BGZ76_006278, partial [Entomortierella beljakovae]
MSNTTTFLAVASEQSSPSSSATLALPTPSIVDTKESDATVTKKGVDPEDKLITQAETTIVKKLTTDITFASASEPGYFALSHDIPAESITTLMEKVDVGDRLLQKLAMNVYYDVLKCQMHLVDARQRHSETCEAFCRRESNPDKRAQFVVESERILSEEESLTSRANAKCLPLGDELTADLKSLRSVKRKLEYFLDED